CGGHPLPAAPGPHRSRLCPCAPQWAHYLFREQGSGAGAGSQRLRMAHCGGSVSIGVEPPWLLARRDQAEKEMVCAGIPDAHNEEWKYSDAGQFLTPTSEADPDAIVALASELSLPE